MNEPSLTEITQRFMKDRYGEFPKSGPEQERFLERQGIVFDALDYYANKEYEESSK